MFSFRKEPTQEKIFYIQQRIANSLFSSFNYATSLKFTKLFLLTDSLGLWDISQFKPNKIGSPTRKHLNIKYISDITHVKMDYLFLSHVWFLCYKLILVINQKLLMKKNIESFTKSVFSVR